MTACNLQKRYNLLQIEHNALNRFSVLEFQKENRQLLKSFKQEPNVNLTEFPKTDLKRILERVKYCKILKHNFEWTRRFLRKDPITTQLFSVKDSLYFVRMHVVFSLS
jgi:hypothetical protein